MKKVFIQTEYIKLNQFLKWAGIADTGGEADLIIAEEKVTVNGETEARRGKKLREGDIISVYGSEYEIAGDNR